MASQKTSKKVIDCYLCKSHIPTLRNAYEVSKDAVVTEALAQLLGCIITNNLKYLCRGCYKKCDEFGATLVKAREQREMLLKQIKGPKSEDEAIQENDDTIEVLEEEGEDVFALEEDADDESYFQENDLMALKTEQDDDEQHFILVHEETDEHGNTIVTQLNKNDDSEMNDQFLNLDMMEIIKQDHTVDSQNESDAFSSKEEEEQPILTFLNGFYYCQICDTNESKALSEEKYTARSVVVHLKNAHNKKVYVCDLCSAFFKDRPSLTNHLEQDHEKPDVGTEFACKVCNRTFTDVRQFRIHKRTHLPTQKIWACKQCDKKYPSRNLLDEHMNMHTGKRPYKCSQCEKDFASKYTLTAHMKIHTERARPFECSQCDKRFYSNQNLVQHERTHTGEKQFSCDSCDKYFATQHNLEVHKITHTGYKPFICRTCGKAFARRAEIRDHERIHTGERPFQCDICTSTFSQRSNLMSHKRATHFNTKPYKCDTCARSFKRRRLLDYHIKSTHTGERPYKCETCEATFIYPEHFKKHIRIHTGVKPYKCEVCGKPFNSRDNRNTHRFTHSEKKPFECFTCGAGFMRKPMLHAHMSSADHHSDTIIINQPTISSTDGPNMELLMCNDDNESDDQMKNIKAKRVYFVLKTNSTQSGNENEEQNIEMEDIEELDVEEMDLQTGEDDNMSDDALKNEENVSDYIITGSGDGQIFITNENETFIEENAVIEEATDAEFVFQDMTDNVEWITS